MEAVKNNWTACEVDFITWEEYVANKNAEDNYLAFYRHTFT